MTATASVRRDDDSEIDRALRAAIRAIAPEIMRGRPPVSVLPGLLRSHLAVTPTRCRCGHHGEWVDHVTWVLDSAGMVARAF